MRVLKTSKRRLLKAPEDGPIIRFRTIEREVAQEGGHKPRRESRKERERRRERGMREAERFYR